MNRYLTYVPDAFRYWRYHRRWVEQTPGKVLRRPIGVGKTSNERLHRIIRKNVAELPIVVEALVHEAPGREPLRIIGSDILEPAFRMHGTVAFKQFANARLLADDREAILAGVWPTTLRQAGLAGKPEAQRQGDEKVTRKHTDAEVEPQSASEPTTKTV